MTDAQARLGQLVAKWRKDAQDQHAYSARHPYGDPLGDEWADGVEGCADELADALSLLTERPEPFCGAVARGVLCDRIANHQGPHSWALTERPEETAMQIRWLEEGFSQGWRAAVRADLTFDTALAILRRMPLYESTPPGEAEPKAQE